MAPEVVQHIADVRERVRRARSRGQAVGLVPTMGALHAGHASLIHAARRQTGFVVVSIFVNPAQFGPNEDFARYPRTLDQDLEVCSREGVDLVFSPSVAEVYPEGSRTFVEVTGLQDVLCGRSRPGHFRGVATVVLKLFQIVQPDVAYFGQKDAQQARIIQRMVADLNVPVEVRLCPIVREPDGLALSSRNQYLTPEQRKYAVVLFQALSRATELVSAGERDAQRLRLEMKRVIETAPGTSIDYVEIVDENTFEPVARIEHQALALLAVKFGQTRLIDNAVLQASPP